MLDQVRERILYLHCSLSTETTYVHWVKFFVRWHGRSNGGTGVIRHPGDMGAAQPTQFLTLLAHKRHVSVSAQHQALSALLFLYAMCWPLTRLG